MIPFRFFKYLFLCVIFFEISANSFGAGVKIKTNEETIQAYLGNELIWQFNQQIDEGKPYFHPLASASGHVFSHLRPADHPWHRGLWFSWKYIDGVNYWEEDLKTGVSQGKTIIVDVVRDVSSDFVVSIRMTLHYCPGDEIEPVVVESRIISILPPDALGKYRIQWEGHFEAVKKDVVLDRTPGPAEPKGKTWGGYAGWSFRMNQESLGGVFQNSCGDSGIDAKNKKANWMKYETISGNSVLFMDHPQNLNYPSIWYVAVDMPFFSPAVIFEKPYRLRMNQPLSLKYQMVIASEGMNQSEVDEEWCSWIK